jgi:hypothetical protein
MAIWCYPNTLGKFSSALQSLLDILCGVWTPLPRKLIHNRGTLVYHVDCNFEVWAYFQVYPSPNDISSTCPCTPTIYLTSTLTASTWDKKVFGMCNQTLKLGPQSHGVPWVIYTYFISDWIWSKDAVPWGAMSLI